MIKKTYIFWIIVSIVGAAIMLIYFCNFYDGFSSNQSDWGNFGAFFSGVFLPFLTAINIYVFISLTKEIEKERVSREKMQNDQEEKRRALELQHQKEMLLCKLKYEEVHKLDEALEATYKELVTVPKGVLPPTLFNASKKISSFRRSMNSLYDFTENQRKIISCALSEFDIELAVLMRDNQDSVYSLGTERALLLGRLKDNLIEALYAIALGKQEKWDDEILQLLKCK